MIYPAEADIVVFLKSLSQGLQSYAEVNDIKINFLSQFKKQPAYYQPFLLTQSVVHLLCNMINLLPPKSQIKIRLLKNNEGENVTIEIENTGLNLIWVNEICKQTDYSFTGSPTAKGTVYRLNISLQQDSSAYHQAGSVSKPPISIPQFYKQVQKRFQSHFSQTEKLIATLEEKRPQEAAFIQKVNALIKVHMDDERFDTNALCKAMSLSRTQLFRRIKSLIKTAPANHIKAMRLQKAKELLETTDYTISEITFKTGFQNISHFTNIFKKQYGVAPSLYRQGNGHATNE